MKSWHYMAIFVLCIALVAGAIVYDAQKINDIKTEVSQMRSGNKNTQSITVKPKQEKIDVMNDADFESDVFDEELADDVNDLDNMDDVTEETRVSF